MAHAASRAAGSGAGLSQAEKAGPRDTQAKWLLFAIAILLGLITAQIIKRLV